jgi:hypothetical protein
LRTSPWMGWLGHDVARRARQPDPGRPITPASTGQRGATGLRGEKVRKKRVRWLICGALASARVKEKEKELRWLGRGEVVGLPTSFVGSVGCLKKV